MAHFLRHPSFISTSVWKEPPLHYHTDAGLKLGTRGQKTASGNGCVVHCSTSSSGKASVELTGKAGEDNNGRWENKEEQQPLYLATENGWKVRRLEEDQIEFREVAQIQAEAFHQPMPLFDDFFFYFFKAEVLAGLMYKLRNSPPNRYACLVAESPSDAKLVGVVDVTALRDDDVLRHLHGAEEYLYVSGLAVSKRFRRKKMGSCLLKACEMLSVLWGFKYLVLRAYEDDLGARTLYANAGYQVVSGDTPWTTSWIGRRRRVLMIKQCNFIDLINSTFHS
ncbi:hypothetical protein HRI_004924400 [Hibiscus trionum]|uniref:N-acetyltransferase domain-containing protein n=1 Tax=Hibiscus trionum TaxID=183268 RepID=A0A9W7MTK6_HIBTR|nr:hypothetical protein HRI_004924400 [Hibiscus trionum]